MARYRIDLQPARTITSNYTQPGEDAARVGDARTGVAYLNLFKVPSTGSVQVLIESTSDKNLGDAPGFSYWATVGSIGVPPSTQGVIKFPISDLGDYVRVRTMGVASEFSFSLVLFLSDN